MTQPDVLWLEDEPIAEWSESHGDRWTNVQDGRTYIDFGAHVFAYDPATSPVLRILGSSNYTTITRRRATRWERVVVFRFRRWRRALALRIDPTIRWDLESQDEW